MDNAIRSSRGDRTLEQLLYMLSDMEHFFSQGDSFSQLISRDLDSLQEEELEDSALELAAGGAACPVPPFDPTRI